MFRESFQKFLKKKCKDDIGKNLEKFLLKFHPNYKNKVSKILGDTKIF